MLANAHHAAGEAIGGIRALRSGLVSGERALDCWPYMSLMIQLIEAETVAMSAANDAYGALNNS